MRTTAPIHMPVDVQVRCKVDVRYDSFSFGESVRGKDINLEVLNAQMEFKTYTPMGLQDEVRSEEGAPRNTRVGGH
jgi:hypothetical protein